MSGIHAVVTSYVRDQLERILMTEVPVGDPARPGVVKLGPLQGSPDPDEARISLEIYENDPDQEISGSAIGRVTEPWDDQVEEIEIGGVVTWKRMFTVKARCLLERSQEDLAAAREIASTVRSRIEKGLLSMRFNGLSAEEGEYVSRGAVSDRIRCAMVQLGGPPDAYDYQIKVRFEILTTTKG
ncbi:MAG: hypothetical protein AAGU17_10110 [Anaerolineaceae bacterium]